MNSLPTRLIIVRHGNTFKKGDTLLRVGKRTDLALVEDEKGNRAGNFIKNEEFNVTRLFSGPLKRHIQTSTLIADVIDFSKSSIVTDDRFDELDYGEYDGKPENEVVESLGIEALNTWDKYAIPPKEWLVDVDLVKRNWDSFLNEASKFPPGEDTVVVTSNGTLRFLPSVLNQGDSDIELKVPTGGIVVLQKQGNSGWKIIEWGIKP